MTDPLDDLRARFIYTAAWMLAGRSWLRFWWWVITCRIVFWRAISGGQTHMMLWVRGRGWIDNIYPQFGPRRHRRLFPLWGPFLAVPLLFKRQPYKGA